MISGCSTTKEDNHVCSPELKVYQISDSLYHTYWVCPSCGPISGQFSEWDKEGNYLAGGCMVWEEWPDLVTDKEIIKKILGPIKKYKEIHNE